MVIQSRRVFLEGTFRPAQIITEGRRIAEIVPYESRTADHDYGSLRVVPGFIDVHCHGAYGFDVNSADEKGLRRWAKKIVSEGVTTFLATTLTDTKKVLTAALENVARVRATHEAGRDGADIAGVHFEGPYLNPAYKGAQPEEAIAVPDVKEFSAYAEASGNAIRILTLAPERDEGLLLTRYAAEKGIAVSIGHSAATYAQAEAAVKAGARSITHTFNAQTPFHHREAGVAGAALAMGDLWSEIICDLHHVSPEALRVFFKCKDKDRAVMVTDALLCKGSAPGERFSFGPQRIVMCEDGCARIEGTDTLAGSTLRMNEGLRNLTEAAGIPFAAALYACTKNPAALIGLDGQIGELSAGFDADIAVLCDDYAVEAVFCKGMEQVV